MGAASCLAGTIDKDHAKAEGMKGQNFFHYSFDKLFYIFYWSSKKSK